MDGRLAIEHNRQALKRIVVALVAIAGLSDRATLPRHVHRAVLRLLRPAEAAARRLVIALARGVVPPPSPPRQPAKTLPQTRKHAPAMPPEARVRAPLHSLNLPLLDRLPQAPPRVKRPTILPRISVPGVTQRIPLRPPRSPHDELNATRLGYRLDALCRALDDLPRQALRLVRWQTRQALRRERGKAFSRWPLRPGRPPGANACPAHEVHDVLRHAHALAWWALEHPDTS